MVATRARARAHATLLTTRGWQQVTAQRLPKIGDIADLQRLPIRSTYDRLGGAVSLFHRIRPGGYDLAFTTRDGLLDIELDEERHFNRYRAVTPRYHLASRTALDTGLPRPQRTPRTPAAAGWGTGQRWTNPSAARFFGLPSQPGDFTSVGAPRLRQRAFYDGVKDALNDRQLAGVSVYDTIPDGTHARNLLRRPDSTTSRDIQDLVSSRVHHA